MADEVGLARNNAHNGEEITVDTKFCFKFSSFNF